MEAEPPPVEPHKEQGSCFWNEYAESRHSAEDVTPRLQPALVGFAKRALEESGIPEGSTVVDLATGAGTVAVILAEAGMNVLAVDFSQSWVDVVNSYGIPNIVAKRMNGESMDLADGSVDAVFSLFGVTLFRDWRAGLAEMYRIARPGGTVSIGTWASAGGACGSRALYLLCNELFTGVPDPVLLPGLVATQSPDGFEAVMLEAGFEDITVIYETRMCELYRHELDEPDRLFAFSSQWGALSDPQRHRVVEVLQSRFPVDGPYLVPSTAGIATARRPSH
jgi:SAM-dependent methyltransferase